MRYLHTMVRVGDLDQSLDFYCNKLGMVEIRRSDHEDGRFSLIFLAAPVDTARAEADQAPLLELTHNWEPESYGATSAAELDAMLTSHAGRHGYELDIFYTHVEGEAIARIYQAVDGGVDGLVMNPAGFVYAGHALRDCVKAAKLPYVEVHMTNIDARGMRSALADVAVGMITGLGVQSYVLALEAMLHILEEKK